MKQIGTTMQHIKTLIQQKKTYIICTSAILFIVGCIYVALTHTTIRTKNVLGSQSNNVHTPTLPDLTSDDISYWLGIISERPDYRDAYVRLILLYYQRGDIERGRQYLQKIRELDPNYEKLPELEALFSR